MKSKETKKTERIKNFVKNHSDIIVVSCLSLAGTALLGYSNYKIGYQKGTRTGMCRTLDAIYDSGSDGFIASTPDLGRYIFTAKKLDD